MKPNEISRTFSLPTYATTSPAYFVVVPFYNEQDAAPQLIQEILDILPRLDGPAECVCINDGSSDGTAIAIRNFTRQPGALVRVISFQKNRGQAAALWAGLHEARGEVIITLDGDGQNDPSDIPALLRHLEHAGMICGIRAERNDTALRRAMSRLANRIRGRILGDNMRDSGCALKAMRREVVSCLLPIRTLYSFIPALAVSGGFRITEIPVRHRARNGGTSNYGFKKFALMPLVDMLGLLWFKRRSLRVCWRRRHQHTTFVRLRDITAQE